MNNPFQNRREQNKNFIEQEYSKLPLEVQEELRTYLTQFGIGEDDLSIIPILIQFRESGAMKSALAGLEQQKTELRALQLQVERSLNDMQAKASSFTVAAEQLQTAFKRFALGGGMPGAPALPTPAALMQRAFWGAVLGGMVGACLIVALSRLQAKHDYSSGTHHAPVPNVLVKQVPPPQL